MSELALQRIAENKKTKATSLDLSRCDLERLPSELSEYVWLKELDLGVNEELSDLSPLKGLLNLQVLNVAYTLVSDLLPLKGLQNLQLFFVFHTPVSDLLPLKDLQNLQHLSVSSTRVSDLLPLKDLQNLQHLSVSSTRVSDLLPLKDLQNLQYLSVFSTQVSNLSPLKSLQNLQYLSVSSTQVSDLSPLKELINLQELYVSYTPISDLSPLKELINLQELDVSSTQVSDLSLLKELINLQKLDVSITQVSDLSPLKELINLQELYVSSTEVSDLSPILPLIKKGIPVKWEENYTENQAIHVQDCPLIAPPLEVVQKGNEAILAYFHEHSKKQFKNTEIKLIFVGNSTVGKTTLSHYLRTRRYEKPPSTHGILHDIWQPEGRELVVHCWDFGGQEYYHATHRLFLSQNAVYALVWDEQTNKGGFVETEISYDGDPQPVRERMEHYPYIWWLRNIRHFTRKGLRNTSERYRRAPVLLIQNKAERDGEQRIPDAVAKEFQLHPEWLDHQLSLEKMADMPRWRRNFENFEEALLTKLEQQLTHFEFAEYHRDIREEVRRLAAGGRKWMLLDEFKTLCSSFDEEFSLDLVTVYLRDITGDILRFPDNPRLCYRVYLDPVWVCGRIYRVLSRQVKQQQGLFGLDWVQQALACDEAEALDFVTLMCEFDLIFEDSDENGQPIGKYIAPQYLPEECLQPDILADRKEITSLAHGFTLQFDFLPKSHIARFLARWGKAAEQRLFWKNGLFFRVGDCPVLVERMGEDRIRVEIQPYHPKREAAMNRIFQSFKDLEEGQASFAISLDERDFVKWSDVMEALQTKAQSIKTWLPPGQNATYVAAQPFTIFVKMDKKTYPLKAFFSYSKDDMEMLKTFKKHLSALRRTSHIELWDDSKIRPGEEWDDSIKTALKEADIIFLLLSKSFIDTDYIWEVEVKEAMRRHATGEAIVVPIKMKPCDWEGLSFSKLQGLPRKDAVIDTAPNADTLWTEVAGEVRALIEDFWNRK